jgi:hypothetical protein
LRVLTVLFALTSLGASLAQAKPEIPECLSGREQLEVDNEQVIKWKASTRNQFKARAHVRGRVVKRYQERPSHLHFSIELEDGSGDRLEVIYNKAFGDCPTPASGQVVVACGDYITSNAPTDRYPASPDGAIIHWVHMSPNLREHEHGYLLVNGTVCGLEEPNDRPRSRSSRGR